MIVEKTHQALKGRVSRHGSGLSMEKQGKEGICNAETYLCESALVQNTLLELAEHGGVRS